MNIQWEQGASLQLITTRLEAKLDFFFLAIELASFFYSSILMKLFSEYGPDFKAKIFLSPAPLEFSVKVIH